MKALLLSLAFLSLFVSLASEACSLTVKVKKASSAAGTINGVAFTGKQLTLLSSSCTIKKDVMGVDEVIALEQAAFNKRIARLKNK
jgi:hypothetical protein